MALDWISLQQKTLDIAQENAMIVALHLGIGSPDLCTESRRLHYITRVCIGGDFVSAPSLTGYYQPPVHPSLIGSQEEGI